MIIGNNHIRLNRIHSTNKYAVDMIAKSKPMEGTVISASYQYEGRGQIGRFWESEEGKNITCSTILRPIFMEASDQFQLNMAISLAVYDFIDHFIDDIDIKIKWPNDIYIGNKKVAGILLQNSLVGKLINTTVVGTGINVNQRKFSDDIPNAISLAIAAGKDFELDAVFPWLFRFLSKRYLQLKSGYITSMRSEYHDLLYRRGEWSYFNSGEDTESWLGKIAGVDTTGRLMIENKEGKILSFGFREVGFLI